MAGIGSSWGTREELLHPRDRHGRFRKKWGMSLDAVGRITGFLDRFQPRSFQSDQQASQYAFNTRKAPWTTPELRRLHMDWDEANESLQAGEMDDTTKKFVDMMDRNMVEAPDDLIASMTVPVESFGLNPQQAALEDGGLEDFIGLEIGDAGYTAANLGSELSHPPGSVTLRIAIPKGTRVAMGGRSPSDRGLALDRDQPLIITKVEPDGRGGYYMLAIAASGKRTQGAKAIADDRTFGRRGAALTPQQREARISPKMSGEERLRIAQQNEREMQTGPSTVTPAQTPAPAAPASPQTPATPAAGVPERREPVQSESIGPGSPEGKSPSDIASDADAAKVQADNAPPAPPAAPTPLEFQEAARDLPIPTSGPQRNEWNKAHSALAQGKRDPGDVLRELDTDIEENKRQAASATHAEKKDSLERNIQAQEQLADLISEKYGVPRRVTSAPVSKKAPAATPGAPSTKRGTAPTVKAPTPRSGRGRKPADVAADIQAATSLEEANAHLEGMTGAELKALADHMEAPVRARATKAQLRQAITFRKGRELDSDAVSGQGAARRAAEAEAVAKKAAPETPAAPAKKAAAPAKAVAKKAAPAKAVPEADAAEEAFKARVAEAGLPDKVADLRAQARDQKIRGFSTMNKRQLQSALLGDEVPRAGKIAPVTPKKLVPHLQAADSDQEARKLLENHTLADLRAMAKDDSVGVSLPSRGVTKDKAKDSILEAIRGGPEGGKGETPARSLDQELKAQKWVEPEDSAARQTVADLISNTDEMDPAELRDGRDKLEDLSKDLRSQGKRQDANLVQTVADAMGIRAQIISGVEEGPARAPAKKAVKKAAPSVPEGEAAPKTLDKMLRTELAQVALDEGVDVKKSATKAQLKEAIERDRRVKAGQGDGPSPVDRAPTLDEVQRDNPDLDVQKLFNDAGIPTNDPGGLVGDTKLTLKQEGPEVAADRLRAEADRMLERIPEARAQSQRKTMPTPADADAAETDVRENARKVRQVAEKISPSPRAKKRVPEGSVPGRAVTTPDRKQSFREAWDGQKLQATGTSAGSLDEVRDDIESGKITPEEGVRRLDSDILFNEDESNDLLAELEGMEPDDRENSDLNLQRAQLEENIRAQKKAKTLIRAHFKDEAPVTRQELEVQLDPAEKAALDRVDAQSLKDAAKAEGLGDIDGDDKDTVIQNIGKAVARRELANREKEQRARDQQVEADRMRTHAEAIAGIEDALEGGSDRALAARIKSQSRASRLGPVLGKELQDAAGDRDAVRKILARVTQEQGLRRSHKRGEQTRFDPEFHDMPPGADLKKGDPVTVLEPGFRGEAKGVDMQIHKAKVTEGHDRTPEAPAAPKKVAKFLPPLKDGTQRKSMTNVEVGDVIQPAGKKQGPAKRVAKVEKGIKGHGYPMKVTFDDGTVMTGMPQTAVWMGRDVPSAPEAPAPAKKAAKAAVPAKATPKVVDLDNPTRHDAELIGTGLDLDPKGEDRQWMDVVQRSLDRGEDGRQIADGLRREADSQRTLHNITESVGGTEGASPAARINRMELMADRLEGVRPIKKAAPAAPTKAAAPDKREMGTMQAASAQSKALFDLRNGKSHAEVATALRQAATGVGSREHDPQTVRPLEFTPSERSAMKRSDAKKLRELAAEIQAQGVAQRTEARAAKKATTPAGKKAAKAQGEFVERMAGERAAFKDLGDKPAKKAAVNPNLSSLSDDELRKIIASDQFPQSQKDKVQKELDARARRDLTGVTGELIKAQLDDAMRRLQEADSPAAERSALAGLLRPELAQLADRLGVKRDRAKSVMINGIIDRVKGREAPGASAERAVPKVEAPGAGAVNESEPLKPFPHDDNMRMHADSPTMQLAFAYEKAGRNGSANRMAQLRARATTPAAFDSENGMSPQQVVDELKVIRAQETDPKFQRMLDNAIEANDAPMTPMPDLPPDTPPLARKLIEDLHAIPYARKSKANGDRGVSGPIRGDSLVDQLAAVYRDAAQGKRGGLANRQPPDARIRDILRGQTHEMNDPSFRIWELVSRLESGEMGETGAKRSALLKELMDWERSHWPKQ